MFHPLKLQKGTGCGKTEELRMGKNWKWRRWSAKNTEILCVSLALAVAKDQVTNKVITEQKRVKSCGVSLCDDDDWNNIHDFRLSEIFVPLHRRIWIWWRRDPYEKQGGYERKRHIYLISADSCIRGTWISRACCCCCCLHRISRIWNARKLGWTRMSRGLRGFVEGVKNRHSELL